MNDTQLLARGLLGLFFITELSSAKTRFEERERLYREAQERARALGRRLVVIGDPDTGTHTRLQAAYGCGDICVDLTGCPACPTGVTVDLTQGRIPVDNNSVVIYCSCVLEYVSDPWRAWAEMLRAAGSPENIFLVTVQGDSLTASLYPGSHWIIRRLADGGISVHAVSDEARLATVAALGLGAYYAR